jgi:RsiW-degrading membrane proteinase PrsW (M82 family)
MPYRIDCKSRKRAPKHHPWWVLVISTALTVTLMLVLAFIGVEISQVAATGVSAFVALVPIVDRIFTS